MNVLVDTSVWSLALRRSVTVHPMGRVLRNLIVDGRAAIIGPIRQELLSGIKLKQQFDALCTRLQAFPNIALESEDHEEAARFFNTCRSSGIQGSNTDFLICAVAVRREMPIFTTDKDFALFAERLPILLFG